MSRLAPPDEPEPEPEQDQGRSDPDHEVEGQVQQGVGRRPVLGGHGVEAGHLGVGAEADQERVEARDSDPPLDAIGGAAAADVLGHVPMGVLHALHRGELDRLVLGDLARRRVADRELDRRQDAADRERDQQAEAVMAVAAPPQHPDRVDRGDQEAGDQVGGQDHVGDLVGDRGVEDHLERVDVGDGAVGAQREALGLVHPGVDGDHREGAPDPADRDRHASPEVLPARQPLPAEDVDRQEDRLEEEEDPLDREQDPEDLPEAPGELGPEQPELEREHGARDRADREGDRGDLRPALGQLERDRVLRGAARCSWRSASSPGTPRRGRRG